MFNNRKRTVVGTVTCDRCGQVRGIKVTDETRHKKAGECYGR